MFQASGLPASAARLNQAKALAGSRGPPCPSSRIRPSTSWASTRPHCAAGPERATPWLLAAAQCGLVEAQLVLGRMRLDGQGGPRDPAKALAWFTRAAEAGSADACNMLGRCHEHGWGTPVDAKAAALWYGKAAEVGDAWAQYNLGHLHLNGDGVRRDAGQALAWYRRAADQGHARAMNLVGRCLEQGWGAAPDPAAAGDWYRRSAEGGYFRGQFNHASLLAAEGRIAEALGWFEQALDGAPADSRRTLTEALAGSPWPELRRLASSGVESHPPARVD